MSFFSIFSRKKYCLMPIYIFKNKNVHSLITHYSHANILSKKRPFSQKHCALMSNKKNHEKSPSVMPIFDQKTSILSKQHYIMSQISQQNALFLRFLTKKLSLLCPYFVKKRIFSKKHTALKSIFCQKNVHSLKNTVLLCHFFKIFMKKTLLSRPYLIKKRQFSRVARFSKFW